MASIFSLPNELLISSINARFPCREQQIRYLATLLSIRGAPAKNIVLYGLEATGKTSVAKAVLQGLSDQGSDEEDLSVKDDLRYAFINSAECITGRHLFEKIVGAVANTLKWEEKVGRPESLAQLVVELEKLLDTWNVVDEDFDAKKRLVLVFDGIDRQREAPPTLLPALARLGEILPKITCIFIVTSPAPNFLHSPGVPHISFPPYNKDSLVQILSRATPTPELSDEQETKETWTKFCGATWEALSKHSGRDILSMRSTCLRLWPKFILPIQNGTHYASQFHKLFLHNRSLFQAEEVLVPTLVTESSMVCLATNKSQGIAAQLPYYSRLLLVASYLASFNPSKTDAIHFMKAAAAKRRKKGGGTALTRTGISKHRKISRKLLGAQAFVLERMLAIFHAIMEDADPTGRHVKGRDYKREVVGSADVQMAIATLASLRLLIKMGPSNAADTLDGGAKYRVAVGWEVIRGVARSVGVEAEDYLAE